MGFNLFRKYFLFFIFQVIEKNKNFSHCLTHKKTQEACKIKTVTKKLNRKLHV